MSIPVITPATTALPATGAAADINTLAQDVLNFGGVAETTILNVRAAATAPAVDEFHRVLNVFMAADQATLSVPNATIQAIGGLGYIVSSILQLIPSHTAKPVTAPAPVAIPVAIPLTPAQAIASIQAQIAALSKQLADLTAAQTGALSQAAVAPQVAQAPAVPAASPDPAQLPKPDLETKIFHPNIAKQEEAAIKAAQVPVNTAVPK